MDCPVCLQEASAGPCTTLPCGHAFHVDCILAWFRRGQPACPVCRAVQEGVRAPRSDGVAILTERGIRNLFRPLVALIELGLLSEAYRAPVLFYLEAQRKLTTVRRRLCIYDHGQGGWGHALTPYHADLLQQESDAEDAVASAADRLLSQIGGPRAAQLEVELLRVEGSSQQVGVAFSDGSERVEI